MKNISVVDNYLLRYLSAFENSFFQEDLKYLKKTETKKSISKTLNQRLKTVLQPFFDKIIRKELQSINPLFAKFPQLATEETLSVAFSKIEEKLKEEPSFIPAGLIENTIVDFANFIRCFLSDFERNKTFIEQTLFDGKVITEITDISATLCLGHEQGCFVLIINTNSGRFVYKKHDCRTDVWLHDFLMHFFVGHVYSPKCWADSDNCGFCEFIDRRDCSKDELSDYCENLGRIASISCALGLSDLHTANYISRGSVPVLIDAEMLFQPLNLNIIDEFLYERFSDEDYNYYLNRSVLRYCNIDSFLKGIEPDADLLDSFLKGFSLGYDCIMKNKNKILQELDKAQDFQVRIVFREPLYYNAWSRKLYSEKPGDYMKSIHNASFPYPSEICSYELTFLKNVNIPYFCTSISSTNLCGTAGKVLIKSFFSKSPVQMVHEKINLMSEDNRIFEMILIKHYFNKPEYCESSSDEEYIDYWEKQLIQAPNGDYFWLNYQEKPKTIDLPPDVEKGTLAIAKRCAEISVSCKDKNLKQKAERLVKIGLSTFERNLNIMTPEYKKRGYEVVKNILNCVSFA